MKKLIVTATLYTLITAVVLGLGYPLLITAIAHATMRDKADGQLIHRNGELAGSALIGQPFTGPDYFHSRPSAAGTGYDASASSGSNLGPPNKALLDRVDGSVNAEHGSDERPVPIDLVTASGSGLDPDISPAAADYQAARIAAARHLSLAQVQQLIASRTTPRQLGLLGEPRVNVLSLNMDLNRIAPEHR